jgi:hypothetical protein
MHISTWASGVTTRMHVPLPRHVSVVGLHTDMPAPVPRGNGIVTSASSVGSSRSVHASVTIVQSLPMARARNACGPEPTSMGPAEVEPDGRRTSASYTIAPVPDAQVP